VPWLEEMEQSGFYGMYHSAKRVLPLKKGISLPTPKGQYPVWSGYGYLVFGQ
jgi:hypothetical protein